MLKNFKINICNNVDFWKFEWKFYVTEISAYYFVKKLVSITHVFEVWTAYRSCLDNDNETNFWNVKNTSLNDLINVSKKLCQKYHDFFNTWNADQLASHQITDHAIDLKFNTEFLYMCMYNMFSAELKTLNNYLNNILIKK